MCSASAFRYTSDSQQPCGSISVETIPLFFCHAQNRSSPRSEDGGSRNQQESYKSSRGDRDMFKSDHR